MADGSVFAGKFVEHKYNGGGTLTAPDGSRYQGKWRDGKRHGPGTQKYSTGQKYQGKWIADSRHGYGELTGPGLNYTGKWSDDVPIGECRRAGCAGLSGLRMLTKAFVCPRGTDGAVKADIVLDEHEVPEEPAAGKGKKKKEKKKPKKGAEEEGPELHDGRTFAPVMAGAELPAMTLQLLAVNPPPTEEEEAKAKAEAEAKEKSEDGGDGGGGKEGDGDGEAVEPAPRPTHVPAEKETGRQFSVTLWFLPPPAEDAEEGTPAPAAEQKVFRVLAPEPEKPVQDEAKDGAVDADGEATGDSKEEDAAEGKEGAGAAEGEGDEAAAAAEAGDGMEDLKTSVIVTAAGAGRAEGLSLPKDLAGGKYFVRFEDTTPELAYGQRTPTTEQPLIVYAVPEDA